MILILLWIACQIIAESFPISSSGHCALLLGWAKFLYPTHHIFSIAQQEYINHLLHLPTLIIIALVFYQQWSNLLKVLCVRPALVIKIGFLSFIAAAVTSFFYFVLHVQRFDLPLGLGFLITAGMLASLNWCKQNNTKFNCSKAFMLGIVQGCALLPGISRLGATYVAARWLGISGRRAIEISFLIQVPLMLGAFALGLPRLITEWHTAKVLNMPVAFVIIISTVIAFFGLRYTVRKAQENRWNYFTWYMIIPLSMWVLLIMLS